MPSLPVQRSTEPELEPSPVGQEEAALALKPADEVSTLPAGLDRATEPPVQRTPEPVLTLRVLPAVEPSRRSQEMNLRPRVLSFTGTAARRFRQCSGQLLTSACRLRNLGCTFISGSRPASAMVRRFQQRIYRRG
jgi:hypothetical protein